MSEAAEVMKGVKPPSITKKLINHVATAFDLVNHDGKAYAVFKPRPIDGTGAAYGPEQPVGVARLLGPSMQHYIVGMAWATYQQAVSRSTVEQVMAVLKAGAFAQPERPLSLRFHHDPQGRRLTVDLGRKDGQCIRISAQGWGVGPSPDGVMFRRSHATKPLPIPERGGKLTELAELMAMNPDSDEFRLLLGWVLGLPFSTSVRPGLLLIGPPGTGKSTRIRLLTSLWEPSGVEALGSCFGQNHTDDQVRASHRAVPLWDNLSAISHNTSDLLCTMVTGAAREVRTLYTTGDLDTQAIQRPVGLTAVSVPAGLRADALDRLVVVEAPQIPHRIDDAEVQRDFDQAHARLLGAACDALAGALRKWPEAGETGDFRMAAFARLLDALDLAELPGLPDGSLLDTYATAVTTVKQRNAADDVFGAALLALLERSAGQWTGQASQLLAAVAGHAQYGDRDTPGWPRTPRKIPEVLNHLRDGLAALGVTWRTTVVRGSTRYYLHGPPQEQPAQPPGGGTGHLPVVGSLPPAGGGGGLGGGHLPQAGVGIPAVSPPPMRAL
ncbi:hypothetical protein [Actinoplanes sp. NPDC026670]|uniref:hypothetical protein n=1 Tax=Actinoplanes sp. NPDC026670 TaxID=3154700 RepID=UPI0033F193F3